MIPAEKNIGPEMIGALAAIVGDSAVIADSEALVDYGHDEFSLREIACEPGAVVKPASTEETAAVLRLAASWGLPITPRGGGTGLCGGCVPASGGLVLSLERMNRVIEIDSANQVAVVEAGVRLGEFVRAAEEAGLYFPPHPGDESAMMGGLIATNAGGSRAVKYGVIRNYVRGLDVVLAGGDVLRLGGKYVKSSAGYNLLHLFIGSEGTLGIITRAVIQLMVKPPHTRSLVIPFDDLAPALEAVPRMLNRGIVPMAVEFMERDVLALAEEHLNRRWPSNLGTTHLLVILDAPSAGEMERVSEAVAEVCLEGGALDVFVADTPDRQDNVLAIRSRMYEAVKALTVEILDICLPRAEVAAHVERVRELAGELDIWLPTFGHAGDGNIHTHIMKARIRGGRVVSMAEGEWEPKAEQVREALFRDCRERGGVVSGEHGIGLVKKPYLRLAAGDRQIGLMKGIKAVFDPGGLLNPGKIFD